MGKTVNKTSTPYKSSFNLKKNILLKHKIMKNPNKFPIKMKIIFEKTF